MGRNAGSESVGVPVGGSGRDEDGGAVVVGLKVVAFVAADGEEHFPFYGVVACLLVPGDGTDDGAVHFHPGDVVDGDWSPKFNHSRKSSKVNNGRTLLSLHDFVDFLEFGPVFARCVEMRSHNPLNLGFEGEHLENRFLKERAKMFD